MEWSVLKTALGARILAGDRAIPTPTGFIPFREHICVLSQMTPLGDLSPWSLLNAFILCVTWSG